MAHLVGNFSLARVSHGVWIPCVKSVCHRYSCWKVSIHERAGKEGKLGHPALVLVMHDDPAGLHNEG